VDQLRFGTDGWRDVIAERFTFANVRRAAQAYAEHLLEHPGSTGAAADRPAVVVGYDTRFLGERFALATAQVLAANGLGVRVSHDYLPTPALSFAVRHFGAAGGVMLTASHNAAEYGGFKLKGAYGGTATDDIYQDVARRVTNVAAPPEAGDASDVERFDVRGAYFDALARLVDVDALRAFVAGGGQVAHDAMGGAGSGWLTGFFRHVGSGGAVEELRGRPDPLFHGVHPEPIPANLAVTVERMRHADAASGPAFALANDGDADRLGVVLPGGAFLNSHQIFALLLDRLQADGRHGRVVKTFTVSRVIERLAAARGLDVVETPVGFKHVVDAMLKGGVLIGGEESGGIGVDGHIPERDGIANGLLLLEAIAKTGVGLAERFRELEREAGWRHAYDRLDLRLADDASKRRVQESLDDPPSRIAGREVVSVERLDGVKLNLGDDAWLLVRASGTEPVLRIYCEGPSEADVRAILEAARRLVEEARG
jgi:phosphomannomutase